MHGRSYAQGAVGHFAGILLCVIDKFFEGFPGRCRFCYNRRQLRCSEVHNGNKVLILIWDSLHMRKSHETRTRATQNGVPVSRFLCDDAGGNGTAAAAVVGNDKRLAENLLGFSGHKAH